MADEFYTNWRLLGMAVARQTIEDYVYIKKHPDKTIEKNCLLPVSVDYLNTFLRSKYFGRICPDYDGYKLVELLESNWRQVAKMSVHRTAKQSVFKPKKYSYVPVTVDHRRKGWHRIKPEGKYSKYREGYDG